MIITVCLQNADGKVTKEEFVTACLRADELSKMLAMKVNSFLSSLVKFKIGTGSIVGKDLLKCYVFTKSKYIKC